MLFVHLSHLISRPSRSAFSLWDSQISTLKLHFSVVSIGLSVFVLQFLSSAGFRSRFYKAGTRKLAYPIRRGKGITASRSEVFHYDCIVTPFIQESQSVLDLLELKQVIADSLMRNFDWIFNEMRGLGFVESKELLRLILFTIKLIECD